MLCFVLIVLQTEELDNKKWLLIFSVVLDYAKSHWMSSGYVMLLVTDKDFSCLNLKKMFSKYSLQGLIPEGNWLVLEIDVFNRFHISNKMECQYTLSQCIITVCMLRIFLPICWMEQKTKLQCKQYINSSNKHLRTSKTVSLSYHITWYIHLQ